MSIVTLSASDMLLAAIAGSMRTVENIKLGRKPAHKADESEKGDFGSHILGCLGELVVCRHLGVDWPGKGKFRGADAGVDQQVRAAERNGRTSLILHDDDADDKMFWHVRRFEGSNRFEIFQPVLAVDGKRDEFWTTNVRSPAFFVPVVPV